MSTAVPKRQRLLAPLQLIGFAGLLLLLLFLVFPRDSLHSRLLGNEQADELAVAYLEAWQRVEPHNIDVLTTLSREYLKGNRPDDAARLLARLRESADPQARQNALLIEIGIAQSELFAASRPELKRQRKSDLLALLTQALPLPWDLRQLQALAEVAHLSGALMLSGRFYGRLAHADSAHAFYWYGKSAQLYLSQLQYREAAQAYFAAQAQAHDRFNQRRSFIAALSVLQMGNLLPEAMSAAATHIGSLARDTVSLRFLARLALAAGRPDLAAIYVARLLQSEPELIAPSSSAVASAPVVGGARAWPVAWNQPLARRTVLVDPSLYLPAVMARAGLMRVSESHPLTTVVAQNPAAQDLDLAYQIYLANGNLAQAEKIAQQALALHLDARVWRTRLAQVAEWNQDPAIALAQSMILSRDSPDEKLWQQIARLARALNDGAAQLAVSLHEAQRQPENMALLDQVVASYEAQGEPEQAARYLALRLHGLAHRPVLERYAALALRMGDDHLALASYNSLVHEAQPNPDDALQLALILFKHSQFQPALTAMLSAQGEADARHQDFWRFYAQLARLLQQTESVACANRHLIAGGVSDDYTLQQMTGSVYSSPLDTARLAGYAYQKNANPQSLALALNGDLRAHALARASGLLQGLTPLQRTEAELNTDFLLARADYLTQSGDAAAGRQDLQQALRLTPTQSDARAAYLWWLIDQGEDVALRTALKHYADSAENDPALIGAYAAGYLHLGQARRALHYFHLDSAGRGRDPLWLLSYAEALDMNQRAGDAWRLRRQVWQRLLPQSLQDTQDPDVRHEMIAAQIGLSDRFAGGDRARAELQLALGREKQESSTPAAVSSLAWRNAALAWAQSHNAYPLEKSWLARQYLNWLSAPASVQFSLALAQNDLPALRLLLAQKRNQVPADTRIDALLALDLPDQALSESFAAQSAEPDNNSLNATLHEQLLAAAQSLSFGWKEVKQGSLLYQESSLGAGLGLTTSQSLNLSFDQRNQQADPTQLPQTPGEDHTLALQYRHFAQDDSEKLTLGQRQAWRNLTPLLLEGSGLDSRPLNFHYSLGSEQLANESPQLMMAGMKNLAGIGVNWRVSPHWFAAGSVEYDRYYLQDREFLGEGVSANIDAGYKFKTDYPDYTLRAVYSHGQYSAYGNPQLGLNELLSPGAVGGASALMPQTLSQSGLLFSFGTDLPDSYSHDWRPYLEAGPVYDTQAHWGASVNLGMVGSVMGGDRMEVFYQHQDMSAQTSSPLTEYGVRYSWFF